MPTIETDRLLLRPFTPEDAPALHEAVFGDEEAMLYIPPGMPGTLAKTQRVIDYYNDHWEQQGYGVWAVVHRADGKLIGQCGLNFVPEVQQTEVLYAIHKDYWGQELALEGARTSCRYGFYRKGLTKIMALAAPENTRSLRVIEKLGMDYRREIKLWSTKLKMYMVTPQTLKIGKTDFRLLDD
jgi:ribosomal-protein-alanine N-acetyltransferase